MAFAFPVSDQDQVRDIIAIMKKEYHDARHHCYGYILGSEKELSKTHDDGEPSHSAGDPILGQIRSRDLYQSQSRFEVLGHQLCGELCPVGKSGRDGLGSENHVAHRENVTLGVDECARTHTLRAQVTVGWVVLGRLYAEIHRHG